MGQNNEEESLLQTHFKLDGEINLLDNYVDMHEVCFFILINFSSEVSLLEIQEPLVL